MAQVILPDVRQLQQGGLVVPQALYCHLGQLHAVLYSLQTGKVGHWGKKDILCQAVYMYCVPVSMVPLTLKLPEFQFL